MAKKTTRCKIVIGFDIDRKDGGRFEPGDIADIPSDQVPGLIEMGAVVVLEEAKGGDD